MHDLRGMLRCCALRGDQRFSPVWPFGRFGMIGVCRTEARPEARKTRFVDTLQRNERRTVTLGRTRGDTTV